MKQLTSLTVVYTINDEAAFQAEFDRAKSLMAQSDGKPWTVTGMSIDDELNRVWMIEDLLGKEVCGEDLREAIREIIQCPNLSALEAIKS